MSEQQIKDALKGAYRAKETDPPSFDKTWAAAARRHRGGRRKRYGGLAAVAAAAALAIGLWTNQPPEDEFMIAEALLNDTSWIAPSDVLMPQHEFDIYREIPVLDESTISPEGSLL